MLPFSITSVAGLTGVRNICWDQGAGFDKVVTLGLFRLSRPLLNPSPRPLCGNTTILTASLQFVLHTVVLFQGVEFAQSPQAVPVPGVVRLPGDLSLKGLISITRSLDPAQGKRFQELRRINQGYRHYFLSTRIARFAGADPSVIPSLEFSIRRKRGRARMPTAIGVPVISAFDRNGEALVQLRLQDGSTEDIRIAVSRINRDMVEITSLTHAWKFGMSLSALPDDVLYPGLLEHAVGFADGGIRLNMVGMLTEASRIRAASALLDSVAAEFPDLGPQTEKARELLRQRTADRILEELQREVAAGQPAQAAASARLFPDEDLTPQVRVGVRNIITDFETQQRRVDAATVALQQTIGEFTDDPAKRQQAREMVTALLTELDVHNIDELTTWELLATEDSEPAESRVALAVSGWLLGADNAFEGFAECYGLFQIRQLIADFVSLQDSEDLSQRGVARTIEQTEGFTVDRVASLIRRMPPPMALPLRPGVGGGGHFQISEASTGMRCIGLVPESYSSTRRYPLLIAIPRQGVSLEETIQWWQRQAERFGFIVAVPEVLPQNVEDYTADAGQHTRMLALIRQLKLGLSIDDNRVFIAGHGVGGEISMDMASSHNEIFAGVISIAGLGRRHLQWSAHNSADLGWYIVVGERQHQWYLRMELLLTRLFTQVRSVKRFCNVTLARYPERGFESFSEELPAIFEWMNTSFRNPWPEKIDTQLMRTTDLSCHWIRLDSLPERFQTLEQPTDYQAGVSRFATVEATLSRNNGIRVRAPSSGVLLLSPDMPGIDTEQPISVRGGRIDDKIEFRPSVRDMLDEYAATGERTRLIYMKLPFGD